jgi:hypothetical protein
MSYKTTFGTAALLCLAARVASPQAILENDSLRLEIIGLKRWTVPMIQDSLRIYAPKDTLLSHACAAILREKLKFADASVAHYTTMLDGKPLKPYLAVTVIEPQDSALVRYREPFRDTLPSRRAWAPVRTVFEKHNPAFQAALQNQDLLWSEGPLDDADSAQRPALPLRRFLRAHRTPAAHRLALTTLATDGNPLNRVAAVVLLANFADSDSTWWALAGALRDPAPRVAGSAAQLLSALMSRGPSPVNWAPATGVVRAILDGTNLFAHNDMMRVLAATQVDPALAPALLKDGGHLVLAKLRAEGRSERQSARRFLVQIAGRDLGDDPSAWEAWIKSLS